MTDDDAWEEFEGVEDDESDVSTSAGGQREEPVLSPRKPVTNGELKPYDSFIKPLESGPLTGAMSEQEIRDRKRGWSSPKGKDEATIEDFADKMKVDMTGMDKDVADFIIAHPTEASKYLLTADIPQEMRKKGYDLLDRVIEYTRTSGKRFSDELGKDYVLSDKINEERTRPKAVPEEKPQPAIQTPPKKKASAPVKKDPHRYEGLFGDYATLLPMKDMMVTSRGRKIGNIIYDAFEKEHGTQKVVMPTDNVKQWNGEKRASMKRALRNLYYTAKKKKERKSKDWRDYWDAYKIANRLVVEAYAEMRMNDTYGTSGTSLTRRLENSSEKWSDVFTMDEARSYMKDMIVPKVAKNKENFLALYILHNGFNRMMGERNINLAPGEIQDRFNEEVYRRAHPDDIDVRRENAARGQNLGKRPKVKKELTEEEKQALEEERRLAAEKKKNEEKKKTRAEEKAMGIRNDLITRAGTSDIRGNGGVSLINSITGVKVVKKPNLLEAHKYLEDNGWNKAAMNTMKGVWDKNVLGTGLPTMDEIASDPMWGVAAPASQPVPAAEPEPVLSDEERQEQARVEEEARKKAEKEAKKAELAKKKARKKEIDTLAKRAGSRDLEAMIDAIPDTHVVNLDGKKIDKALLKRVLKEMRDTYARNGNFDRMISSAKNDWNWFGAGTRIPKDIDNDALKKKKGFVLVRSGLPSLDEIIADPAKWGFVKT